MKSFKVCPYRNQRISEHFLISCQITLPQAEFSTKDSGIYGIPLDIKKWDRRDKGEISYWIPMQQSLEYHLRIWSVNLNIDGNQPADCLVQSFNNSINSALESSLKVRRIGDSKIKSLEWNNNVFQLRCNEVQAFKNFKAAKIEEKEQLKLVWKD